MTKQCISLQLNTIYSIVGTNHSLSEGGGGMLTARVPLNFCTSTVSISLVLDTSVIAFLMYLFSVALWKYLEAVILLMYFIIFFPVPPDWLVLPIQLIQIEKCKINLNAKETSYT